MGNIWARIVQEHPTYANHSRYVTRPIEDFDYVVLDPDLDLSVQTQYTAQTEFPRHPWFEARQGRLRIQTYAAGDNIGCFLKAMWGNASLASSIAPYYLHGFRPIQAHTSWTIWDCNQEVSTTWYREYQGWICDRLVIDVPRAGTVTITAEGPYATERMIASAAMTMPAMPTVRPFVYGDATITASAALSRAEAVRFTFTRDVIADALTVGNRARQYLIAGGFGLTIEVDMDMNNYTQLQDYYGSGGQASVVANVPGDLVKVFAGVFTLDGPVTGASAGIYDQYQLVVTTPSLAMTGHKKTQTRRDRPTETLTFECLWSPNNYMRLVNRYSSYVAA